MKRQVRRGVFETNSSSTHSISICTQKQFTDWQNGKLLYNEWDEEFVESNQLSENDKRKAAEKYETRKQTFWKDWVDLTEDEKTNWYGEYSKEKRERNGGEGTTFDDWRDDELDYYYYSFTTSQGEKLVAFGKYGFC